MVLQSPIEDFRNSTLKALGGLFAKLEYLSELRNEQGDYSHWGLERVHGETAAQQAIAEAHRSTTAGILRSSLRRLAQEVETSSGQSGVATEQYLQGLCGRYPDLLPSNAGPGSEQHFKSVLLALLSLSKPR